MSRLFDDGSSQYLENVIGSPIGATLTACTMSAWFYSDSSTVAQCLVQIQNKDDNDEYFGLFAQGAVGGDPVRAVVVDPSVLTADTSTGYSINTWHHACGTFDSGGIAAFIDGGSKNTDGTAPSIQVQDSISIGRQGDNTPASYMSGRIAEVAVWDVTLTDAEIAILALGYSPLLIRPQNLVFYCPIIGRTSPEIDIVGGFDMTLANGPTTAEHPRIFHQMDGRFYAEAVAPTDVSGKVLANLRPTMYIPATSNYATLALRNRRPVFEFDPSTSETAYFKGVIPQQYENNGISVNIFYTTTGTSGTVIWDAQFEKIADMDDDGFDSAQEVYSNVPSVSGKLKIARIRFSNSEIDSLGGGDAFRLKVYRNATLDNLLQNAQIHWVELRET